MQRFPLGDTAVIGDDTGFTFTVDGTLTDPSAVTIVITSPSGVASTYHWPSPPDITRIQTGTFSLAITVNEIGVWSYVITGTGAAEGVQSGSFDVFANEANPNNYATLEELKAMKGINDALDDWVLNMVLGTVSRQIDHMCGSAGFHFCQQTGTRTFVALNRYQINVDPIASSSGIVLKTDSSGDGVFETTWSSSDYQLLPQNAPAGPEASPWRSVRAVGTQTFPLPYTALIARRDRVQITATWGFPSIPDPVRQATLLQAAQVAKLKDAPFGVIALGDTGTATTLKQPLNPGARSMLQTYLAKDTFA